MSELVRANRISVQVDAGVTSCRYWRTHKLVKEISQAETGFVPNDKLNSTANRELFRAYMIDNANAFGIAYDPADRREDANKFPSKYTNEGMLQEWACKLVETDVREWTSKVADESKQELVLMGIEADVVEGVITHNGKPVSPQYGNGNWAYAKIPVTVTVKCGDVDGYVTMVVTLVSGQMKKPGNIGELGYTYTGFKTELGKDIKEVVVKPESKQEDKVESKQEVTETPEPKQEQVQEDKKGSKGRGKGKKGSKGDTK